MEIQRVCSFFLSKFEVSCAPEARCGASHFQDMGSIRYQSCCQILTPIIFAENLRFYLVALDFQLSYLK